MFIIISPGILQKRRHLFLFMYILISTPNIRVRLISHHKNWQVHLEYFTVYKVLIICKSRSDSVFKTIFQNIHIIRKDFMTWFVLQSRALMSWLTHELTFSLFELLYRWLICCLSLAVVFHPFSFLLLWNVDFH